jgi:glycosyltransferase involved in cell wall biosynthesis
LLLFEKISISFVDHVIIANHIWYEKLINRSVKSENCTPILNYPDPSIFNADLFNKPNGKFILAYAGSLHYHQGLDIAVKALSLIKDPESQIELHIYGVGREKSDLERLADELGVSDKIHFNGVVPLEEIPLAMSNVHVGVVPKRKDTFGNEAFSTKILEFMGMGIPVIVADTKIDKYYFSDSFVCFFESGNEYSLAEKILLLKKDTERREQYAKQGIQFVAKNNWHVKKKDYMNIIGSFFNTRKYKHLD